MLSLVEGLQIIQVNGVHMLLGSSKNFFVGSNIYLLPSAVIEKCNYAEFDIHISKRVFFYCCCFSITTCFKSVCSYLFVLICCCFFFFKLCYDHLAIYPFGFGLC